MNKLIREKMILCFKKCWLSCLSGLKFAANNPEITLIGNWVLKNKGHPIYNEVAGKGLQNAQKVYTELLELAISRSEIGNDIDLNFMSHTVTSISASTMAYFFQIVKGEETDMWKLNEDITGTVDLFDRFYKIWYRNTKKGR